MPTAKKPASGAVKTKAATASPSVKPAINSKKKVASTAVAKVKKPAALTPVVVKPTVAKVGTAPKKATARKTTASVTVTRTSSPRTSSVTVKKITRNIVGFYMTEDIEIRRATRSDNMSNEKLKAKYAQLKTKIKSR